MRIFKHPIKKLTLLSAFGGGYVLGAKAGRERYEQIREAAQQVKADPRVQQAAAQADHLVRDATTKVTEDPRVKDVVSRAEDILRDAGLKSGTSDDVAATDDPRVDQPPAEQLIAEAPVADDPGASEDEIVYSTGPDIEETIDELAGVDVAEQPITERDKDA